jgi:hypothetical protein
VAGHGGLFQIVALALLGLRDKTVFLAARGEHYGLNDHFSYVVAVR